MNDESDKMTLNLTKEEISFVIDAISYYADAAQFFRCHSPGDTMTDIKSYMHNIEKLKFSLMDKLMSNLVSYLDRSEKSKQELDEEK